ncbi:MAG: MAPEG family protein [Gammaproteobacteria bacterium]|nr:MAPEG family protein [Gammaproteobacteria bacterium]
MESIALQLPLYTAASTACLMLIQVALMFSVIKSRGDLNIFIGHGDNAMLERRIRAHGNFIENVPTFLIGLLLLELMIGSGLWVFILGAVVVVARLSHAIALMANSGVTAGRLIGTLGTVIPTVVTAGYLIVLAVDKL